MASLHDQFVSFDPNRPESHEPFATFAPGREYKSGGAFKQHRSRAAALSAVANNRSRVKLYAWDESAKRWKELAVFDMHNKVPNCDSCGVRFMTRDDADRAHADARAAGARRHRLPYFQGCNEGHERLDRQRGKLIWPPVKRTVCTTCKNNLGL